MKKNITSLLLILFLLISCLLVSCTENESTKETTDGGTTAEATEKVLTEEEKLRLAAFDAVYIPDGRTQKKIENCLGQATIYWLNVESTDMVFEHDDRCYGVYGEYTVFLRYGKTDAETTISIGGVEFFEPCGFSLLAFRDGEVKELRDVFEAGEISLEDINAIKEKDVAIEKYLEWVKENDKRTEKEKLYQNAKNAITELDEETKGKIEKAMAKRDQKNIAPNWYGFPDKNLSSLRCYGVFEKCIVLFEPTMLTAISTEFVADSEFTFGSSFGLYGYCNGEICALEEAYEKGYITREEVAIAAARHKALLRYDWRSDDIS